MHVIEKNHKTIFILAFVVSLILSYWSFYRLDVINPDGICYVESAAAMQRGIQEGMHWCGQAAWPLYSTLIFLTAHLTSLSYQTAAYTLNSLLTLLTVFSFIGIIRLLTTSTRVLWLALGVILLAHEFNALRTEVIRDHGYWGFYLLSLFFFIRYILFSRMRDAIFWSLSILAATFFRIEGALFWIVVPFVVFLDTTRPRFKSFLQLNSLLLLGILSSVIWILAHPGQSFGRFDEVFFQLHHGWQASVDKLHQSKTALADHVLSVYSMRDAGLILFCMLVSWYLVSVFINVSFVYGILMVYAAWKKLPLVSKAVYFALLAYVLVNVLITFVFLVENLFLTKRYLTALSLTLMLWVPFAIDKLMEDRITRRWPLYLVFFFIGVAALGGIFRFGTSKVYIHEAGVWLQQHTSKDARIYSNDIQVKYYSGHFNKESFSKPLALNELIEKNWQHYDYVALRFNKKTLSDNQDLINKIPTSPVLRFKDVRDDEVIIWRVKR